MTEHENRKIGFLSRVDFLSPGYRQALVNSAFEIFKKEGVHFVILLGGLIAKNHLKERIKNFILEKMEEDTIKKRNFPHFSHMPTKAARQRARRFELADQCLRQTACELVRAIPRMGTRGSDSLNKSQDPIDIFVITSLAFDGDIGDKIVRMVEDLRPDIRVWNSPGSVGGRFLIKYIDKVVWALTPEKAVWMRSDYFSTPAERVIKDKTKQTAQASPDIYAIGCFGSAIHKPDGELPYRYFTIPACHRLETTRVNENQIGAAILQFVPEASGLEMLCYYSFKDLVAHELSFITPPPKSTKLEKAVVRAIQERGETTTGILQYTLREFPAEEVKGALEKLKKERPIHTDSVCWPGIVEQSGRKFQFNRGWMQKKLRYSLPKEPWHEDRIVSFCCLHAGSIQTDYQFFMTEVPRIILRHNATVLVNAGDTKEELRHDLDKKGEIIAGMGNNTIQEEVAAGLIGKVLLDVFIERFRVFYETQKSSITSEEVRKLTIASLLSYYYILGNHDLWEVADGHKPLAVFQLLLERILVDGIRSLLGSFRLSTEHVTDVVRSKLLLQEFFKLPSGLQVSIQHPHMSRTKTTSIRPQEMLAYGKRFGCQVVIGGNFHTSETVLEWDQNLGQCVVQQVGTLKHGSEFENHKMKTVDQGIGYLGILSKQGRIISVENLFQGAPRREPVNNTELVRTIMNKIKIPVPG